MRTLPAAMIRLLAPFAPLFSKRVWQGSLREIHRCGDRYVLLEVTPASGNRLLRFSSEDRELVYAAYAQELGSPLQ